MPGVTLVNDGFFNEFTLRLPRPAAPVVEALGERRHPRRHPGQPASIPSAQSSTICCWSRRPRRSRPRISTASQRGSGRCCDERLEPGVERAPCRIEARAAQTISGNRGLQIEEPLLFEQDSPGHCGVDLPEPPAVRSRLGGLERREPIGLPGLSEPQIVRHFTRLSQKNYAIDSGLYPLGSCTMKHNPRLNEKIARLPGFARCAPVAAAFHRAGRARTD